jgi:predicted double-glycine peptidase
MQEQRREHVFLQQWDYTCGAAALATILNYQYGEPIQEAPIVEFVLQTGRSYESILAKGLSLLELKRFAGLLGYKGIGYGKLSVEDMEALNVPAIVPVNLYGFHHFVVFRGLRRDTIFIADPSWGNTSLTRSAFEQAWQGNIGFILIPKNKPKWQEAKNRTNRLAPDIKDIRTPYTRMAVPSLSSPVSRLNRVIPTIP